MTEQPTVGSVTFGPTQPIETSMGIDSLGAYLLPVPHPGEIQKISKGNFSRRAVLLDAPKENKCCVFLDRIEAMGQTDTGSWVVHFIGSNTWVQITDASARKLIECLGAEEL